MRGILAAFGLLLGVGLAWADSGLIRLEAFPSMSVSDGRSTVTISAVIRDTNGQLVANGTQVVFTSTLGEFREPVVKTNNGIAHAVLVAGTTPGTAKITASALAYNATSTQDYEFVANRSLLSTAKEFIEIVGPNKLLYSMDQMTVGSEGTDEEPVELRYREVVIEAKAIQVDLGTYEVRAQKAKLTMDKVDQSFDHLNFNLNQRKGHGVTIYEGESLQFMALPGGALPMIKKASRYGVVEITPSGIRPPTRFNDPAAFDLKDLTETETTILSKKLVAFPRKNNIQFHKAEIFVGETRVLSLPLYQSGIRGNAPILTEQIFNINDNQLAVNYPHFLSLKPGETSLLRLTTGESYGRGYGVNRGLFLNYELNWNRGDDMDGGLTVSGINRDDWGFGIRHFMRIDDRTSASAQVEFPAHQSVFGSTSLSRQFEGFSVSLNGSSTRTLRGTEYTSQQASLIAETNPRRMGSLPIRYSYGFRASQMASQSAGFRYSQESAGIQARMWLPSQKIDNSTTYSADFTLNKLYGQNTLDGLGYAANLSLTKNIVKGGTMTVRYGFLEDGFSSNLIGRQSLSVEGYYSAGRTSFSALASRSLDLDRFNYFVDASYRISGIWRIGYGYTFSRYLTDSFLDYDFLLGYNWMGREFGLTWSNRTKRFAIQVLGTPIG